MILFVGLIHLNVFSQATYKKITVSKDVELIQLNENAWVHVSWYNFPGYGRIPCNGLIFKDKSDAFLFDTPATDSMTKELVDWMTGRMHLKVAGFVPNHWHQDCMGGLKYLQSLKIPSYACQKTIEIAGSMGLPVPEHGFRDSLQLSLGDKIIDCYYFGAAHSMDNIVVWIPSEKILFAGCMVKSMDSKSLGNTSDGDLKAYPATIELLLQRFPSADTVIPGHGDFGGTELIRHTRDLILQQKSH